MRNAAATTVAPTGTISILADCSGGIEPLFSVVFVRHVLAGARLLEVNRIFRDLAQRRGFYCDELLEQIARQGSLAHLDQVPDDLKRIFRCALDIAPESHVRMQAAFQQHCDAAISKTINFPEDAPVEHVAHIYRLAHELGCKGITIYRYGSRPGQPMARDDRPAANGQAVTTPPSSDLPQAASCCTIRRKPEVAISENHYDVRCPNCGEKLSFTEGCVKCQACGYTQC
jgi:ribonucleoside-diphosphate reductase alpha chain